MIYFLLYYIFGTWIMLASIVTDTEHFHKVITKLQEDQKNKWTSVVGLVLVPLVCPPMIFLVIINSLKTKNKKKIVL